VDPSSTQPSIVLPSVFGRPPPFSLGVHAHQWGSLLISYPFAVPSQRARTTHLRATNFPPSEQQARCGSRFPRPLPPHPQRVHACTPLPLFKTPHLNHLFHLSLVFHPGFSRTLFRWFFPLLREHWYYLMFNPPFGSDRTFRQEAAGLFRNVFLFLPVFLHRPATLPRPTPFLLSLVCGTPPSCGPSVVGFLLVPFSRALLSPRTLESSFDPFSRLCLGYPRLDSL